MRTLLISISAQRANQRDVWYDKLISGFVFNFPGCESGSIGSRHARIRRAPRLGFVQQIRAPPLSSFMQRCRSLRANAWGGVCAVRSPPGFGRSRQRLTVAGEQQEDPVCCNKGACGIQGPTH